MYLRQLLELINVEFPRKKFKEVSLEFNGRYYPPKYVISLANKYANGYNQQKRVRVSPVRHTPTAFPRVSREIQGGRVY
ncbi:MAG TPA: hypothetical protein EYH15_02895 [Methanothermococcus okinawensis]|uniref:Uncharacterized protein n=1 Tax=Methanothermococcus okinawensis TaxID=155863 RepID=A0A832Z7Q4_9EURY|nr:hypothetical protein [Methanothermococcus okinawensis]